MPGVRGWGGVGWGGGGGEGLFVQPDRGCTD